MPRRPASASSVVMGDLACRVCGDRGSRPLWTAVDHKFGGPGRFHYVRCMGCGVVTAIDPPDDDSLAAFYPDDVTPVATAGSGTAALRQRLKRAAARAWRGYGEAHDGARWLLRALTLPLRSRVVQLPARRDGGRVLDIGCGSGGYLAFLAELGWACYGIEPGARSRGYATSVLGLDVRPGPLERVAFPPEFFDVVTLWHVIEHLRDPVATLREIHRVLRPGGLLLLRTPNADSLEARVFGACWHGLDAPRHLVLFGRDSLGRALAAAGFRTRRMVDVHHLTDGSRSLLYLAEARRGRSARDRIDRQIRMIELALLALAPERVPQRREGAAAIYTSRR